jgi:3',5'-nucleoside bisphosphate phosphatase
MKTLVSVLLVFFVILTIHAQPARNLIGIPDIPGYKVLKCDFHMHTVFSDGVVWPDVRVGEAWQEGLDAIAITDHLEYTPHKDYIPVDFNASYTIAEKTAASVGLILVKGTEITKSMPPGHFNALFIKDASKIYNDDYKAALREAKNQGAFIIWNHPGWKAQTPDGAVWMPEHQSLFDEKLFDGIEVINHNEWYPNVLDWAQDKKLTICGNSDVHDPMLNFLKLENLDHRPITLVFATERSAGGIHDALTARRTVGWFKNLLVGNREWLEKLFFASVSIKEIGSGGKSKTLELTNLSDFTFELSLTDKPDKVNILPAGSSIMVQVPKNAVELQYLVNNMLIRSDTPVKVSFSLK